MEQVETPIVGGVGSDEHSPARMAGEGPQGSDSGVATGQRGPETPVIVRQMAQIFQQMIGATPQRPGNLQQIHCTPEERVECVTSLLQEDAYRWWTSIADTARPEERT